MKTVSILGFAAALALAGNALAQSGTSSGPSTKMSQSDCTSLWSKMDAGKSGSLTESQVKDSVPNFKSADTNQDSKLSQSEFMTACSNGGVISRGLTGTENQTGTTSPSTSPTTPSGPGSTSK